MKKFMKSIQMMAALLVAVAATTACTNDDNIADEPNTTTDAPKTYTMTVNATMGGDDATTRALSIDGTGALNATWTAGDKVAVLKLTGSAGNEHWELLGELTAGNVSADGLSCTLTGSFDADRISYLGGIAVGSCLRLIYPGTRATSSGYSIFYTGQDGTLEKIATDYDYCSTSAQKSKAVTVTAVDGTNITTTPATFTNNQAIVRFTLTDADGDPIYPTSLTISAKSYGSESLLTGKDLTGSNPTTGIGALTITLDGTTNVVYAALRGFSGKDVTLTADEIVTYTYAKSGVTFDNGKYYTVNVKMQGSVNNVSLNDLTDDYTARDGDVLTGTLPGGKHVEIPAGAKVMLYNATISASGSAGIVCLGDAVIFLKGTNSVTSTTDNYPAIQPGGSGTTLTISGSGSLTATGGNESAGIGSGYRGTCGNIVISGGTVNATGGNESAGIGSGTDATCGNITINGGTITANGGVYGAGIGSGSGSNNAVNSICGDIIISGGTVTATGGMYAAGIGSGYWGKFGSINIDSGITSVTARRYNDTGTQVPIGMGYYDKGSGSVTIDGTTTWTAGTATTNLNFVISTTTYTNDTWTLTHK